MGGKTQTSTSGVSIPPSVLAQYNSVNAQAQQTASTPFQTYSGEFVAPVNAEQTAGITATNAAANEAQPYYQAATGTLGSAQAATNPVNTAAEYGTAAAAAPISGADINSYLSPYLGDVLESTEALQNQSNQQQQAGQLGNAINSGAFGSDRTGIAAANLEEQQNLANNSTIANIANTGYQSALGEANTEQQAGLQGANQLASIGSTAYGEAANTANELGALGTGAQSAGLAGAQAQLAAGTVQQQTQQAEDTALYNQFEQQQSYPFQVDQFLAGIAEGTGSLSGSTTTTTQPGGFFSDRRLKRDIKKIGETFDHQDVVSYKMGDDNRTHIGLIAQNVEKKHPEAVGLAAGYKTVDYGKATKDAANQGHFYAGGVVAFPRKKYASGGYPGDAGGLAGVLQAQQAMYGQMGGAGASGVAGTSRVPTQSGPAHMLAVASGGIKPSQSGAQNTQQAADLIKTGYGLYKDFKKPAPTTTPAATPMAGAPSGSGIDTANGVMGTGISPTGTPTATGVSAGSGAVTAGAPEATAVVAPAVDATADAAGLDAVDAEAADLGADAAASGAADDALALMKRGGRIGYDLGGTPYDTGEDPSGDLDIPDDQTSTPSLKAAPASAPKPSEFQQLLGVIPFVGPFLENYGRYAHGGVAGNRRGYDDGGMPTDDSADDDTPVAVAPSGGVVGPDPAASQLAAAAAPSESLWDKVKGVAESPGVLAALEGIGAMGTARTVHPGVALAAGLEAAAGAYPGIKQGLAGAQQTQAQAQGQQIQNQIQAMKAKAASEYLNPTSRGVVPRAAPTPTPAAAAPATTQPPATSYGYATGSSPTTGAAAPSAVGIPAGAAQIPSNPAAQTAAQIDQTYRQKYFVQPGYTPNEQAAMQQAIKASMVLGDAPVNAVKQAHDNRVQTQQAQNKNAAQAEADSLYAQATDPTLSPAAQQAALVKLNAVHQWTGDTYVDNAGQKINSRTGAPAIGVASQTLTPEQNSALIAQAQALVNRPNSDGTVTQMPAWQALGAPSPQAYADQLKNFANTSNATGATGAPGAATTGTARPAMTSGAPPVAPSGAGAPAQGAPAPDPYLSKALADPSFKLHPPPVHSGTSAPPAVLEQQKAQVAARSSLETDSQDATATAAQSLTYLNAAQQIIKAKGTPPTGLPGEVQMAISHYTGGGIANASNYQAVAKYLSNAALQNARSTYGNRMTQSEVQLQLNEMNPSLHMTPQAISSLVQENIRNAQYTIDTATRAPKFLAAGGDPQQFAQWNQQYFPREQIVNAGTKPDAGGFIPGMIYHDARGNRSTYLGNGKWQQ